MGIIKVLLVGGMALLMTFAVLGNVTMPDLGLGAVQTTLSMETTLRHPGAIWRAITSPALVHVVFGGIILVEASAAVLCWIGAARMFTARKNPQAFESAKSIAVLGLGVVAALYFIGWLVFANEWFDMWQSQKLNVLQDAFRIFASAMLITLVVTSKDA
jgi:predicted small integral membrane protein